MGFDSRDYKEPAGKLTIEPGEAEFEILDMRLEAPPYDDKALQITFFLEQKMDDPEFEGFLKDKSDESKGRYKGKTGYVSSGPFAYTDHTFDDGKSITKEKSVFDFIMKFIKALKVPVVEASGITGDTIEEFFENAKQYLIGEQIYATIAGKQYENKEGYINYNLFFPKSANKRTAFTSVEGERTKFISYDKIQHNIEKKGPDDLKNGFDGKDKPTGPNDDLPWK